MCFSDTEKDNERILIVGADSMLGNALSQALQRSGKFVLGTTRRRETLSKEIFFLDFEDDISLPGIPDNISMAFIFVGINSLDYCRREPGKTARVNVDNTVKLAKVLVKAGTFVVFLSTNLVYDCSVPFVKADAPVSPQTELGRQKAAAERRLFELGGGAAVIRFTKIVGPTWSLIQNWISALQNKKSIHPFSDKVVSPMPLTFAIDVLCRMVEKRLSGILQVSGDRDITYAEWAYAVAQRMGVDRDLVQPILERDSGLFLEHSPRNTTLDTTRLVNELGMSVPCVMSNLPLMIDQNIATSKRKGYSA